MAKIQFNFYTTVGCHLCDQANIILQQLIPIANIHPVEIAESEYLITQYGTRIPVIKRLDNHRELAWPFDAETLIDFAQ